SIAVVFREVLVKTGLMESPALRVGMGHQEQQARREPSATPFSELMAMMGKTGGFRGRKAIQGQLALKASVGLEDSTARTGTIRLSPVLQDRTEQQAPKVFPVPEVWMGTTGTTAIYPVPKECKAL